MEKCANDFSRETFNKIKNCMTIDSYRANVTKTLVFVSYITRVVHTSHIDRIVIVVLFIYSQLFCETKHTSIQIYTWNILYTHFIHRGHTFVWRKVVNKNSTA